MSSKTLLRSSYLLPKADEPLIEDGAVVWEGDTILEVGEYVDVRSNHPDAIVNEYKNQIILPGFVNAHDHGTGVGYPQMGVPDAPLELWLPLLFAACYPDPYLAAFYQGLLLLSRGVTTTMHQHDPRDWSLLESELEETARGYHDAGIRASISLTLADRNQLAYIGDKNFISRLPKKLATQIREAGLGTIPLKANDFIDIGKRLKKCWEGDSRIKLCWGPFAPQWCSDDLLMAIHNAADGAPIQLHLLETRYQQTYAEHNYEGSTAAHLDKIKFLTPNVSCAHGVWLTIQDIDILANTDAMVVHCPSSNLRTRSGIAPVLDLLEAGVNVGIGLDGVSLDDHQDMFLEMRLARGLAFDTGLEGRFLTTQQVLKMATQVGARIVGQSQVGYLGRDAKADLFTVRLDNISQAYRDAGLDLVEGVLLTAQARDIDTVVVAGEIQLKAGKNINHDLQDIKSRIFESLSSCDRVNKSKIKKLVDELFPYLREVYADW